MSSKGAVSFRKGKHRCIFTKLIYTNYDIQSLSLTTNTGNGVQQWQLAYKQLTPIWFKMSQGRVKLLSTHSLFVLHTPLTRTTVCPGSGFWERLSVFLVLSARGRRRFRKLKRASRLKLFLVLDVKLMLLLPPLLVGALSRFPSEPSARSPEAKEEVVSEHEMFCSLT